MRTELLERLREISEEEKMILKGRQLDREIYTSDPDFDIDRGKLLSMGKYITARPHTRFVDFPEHGHNYVEIMYVCNGTITHIIDQKEVVMHSGDLLFMNQHVRHGIKRAGREDIGINFIIMPEFFNIPLNMMSEGKNSILAEFLIGTLRIHTGQPQYLHFCSRGNMQIENLMENIIASFLYDDKMDENINQFTMGLIFLHLLNHIEFVGKSSMQDYPALLADSALQYISRHYQTANLTELAKNMNQSISNMSKMIKNATGCTFLELLQRKRFQQAVTFLLETNLTIAEIMNAVGYENSSYFYKKFREKYHASPREYRIAHRNDEKIRI